MVIAPWFQLFENGAGKLRLYIFHGNGLRLFDDLEKHSPKDVATMLTKLRYRADDGTDWKTSKRPDINEVYNADTEYSELIVCGIIGKDKDFKCWPEEAGTNGKLVIDQLSKREMHYPSTWRVHKARHGKYIVYRILRPYQFGELKNLEKWEECQGYYTELDALAKAEKLNREEGRNYRRLN